MSAIKTDKLRRWGDTTPSLRLDAAQAADASNTDTLKAASKFPLDKDVNNKVVLWYGHHQQSLARSQTPVLAGRHR